MMIICVILPQPDEALAEDSGKIIGKRSEARKQVVFLSTVTLYPQIDSNMIPLEERKAGGGWRRELNCRKEEN